MNREEADEFQAPAKKKEASNLYILKLSMLYFATGMSMLLFALILAIWKLPELVQAQSFRSSDGWLLAHLLLLGFATTIAMGASFQLVQVVMRTALYSRSLGYIQFFLYTFGYAAMITGFLVDMRLVVLGGSSVAIGTVLYAINIGVTLHRKREWNVFVLGVGLSIIALIITISLGIRLGLSLAYGGANHYDTILGSHLWFGIAGWLGGFIILFSTKLLPMFYISSKKPGADTYWIIGLFHVAVWVQAVSLWSTSMWVAWIALACMSVALVWFCVYVYEVRRLSRSKRPIGVVSIALHLIPIVSLVSLVWNGYYIVYGGRVQLLELLIVFIVLGWFTPTILSYLSKILPFLWWAHRFQTKEEKKGAVLLTNMLPERRMAFELIGMLVGVVLVMLGYMLEQSPLSVIGQVIVVATTVIYMLELLKTFRY